MPLYGSLKKYIDRFNAEITAGIMLIFLLVQRFIISFEYYPSSDDWFLYYGRSVAPESEQFLDLVTRPLAGLADRLPVFPAIANQRSMLYIENLAEFLRLLAESGRGGVFFPQNEEYVATARMVRAIASAKGKRIRLVRALDPLVRLAGHLPGRAGGMVNKAFGSLTVDQALSVRDFDGYRRYSLEESIGRIYENQHYHGDI